MKFIALFLDTETNGLPKKRSASTTDYNAWPQVVQLAYKVVELDTSDTEYFREIETVNTLIKPEEPFEWSKEAETIHKIREEDVRKGRTGISVYSDLKTALRSTDILIAHNLEFDLPIVLAQLHRHKLVTSDKWFPNNQFCTMRHSTGLCKIPSKFYKRDDPYKYPRLSELHTFLFGAAPSGAEHDALFDVETLIHCFKELVRRRLVLLKDLVMPAFATVATVATVSDGAAGDCKTVASRA